MAGEQYVAGSWGKLDWWHRSYADKLMKNLLVLREVALMRDAAYLYIDSIDAAIEMAERLAKGDSDGQQS